MRNRAGGGGRRMRGLVVGIVTNISDPEKMGRVKVKFPWLDDAAESNWARVVGFYAGASRGAMFIPEVNDEVMLAFDNGDPNHPYVLGAVWNGKSKVAGPGNTDGKNDHKWFRSRQGHDLEFLDTSGGEKIRLVDCSTKNSLVFDTAGDTITTEVKQGSITISACKNIQIDCVDFKITTSKERGLTVGAGHTVSVGASRTVNVSQGSMLESAGSSYSVTSATMSASASSHSSVSAGAMTVNSGSLKANVTNRLEMTQSAVLTRTVGKQKTETTVFSSTAPDGGKSGVFTLTSGPLKMQSKTAIKLAGKTVTVMGGVINLKGSTMVVAKGTDGAPAALSSWMGGLLMLNPGGITMPAGKMLDMILGFDVHGPTAPSPSPPFVPLPLVPMPFVGPVILDIKPTVLINFMPAAGSGATSISFHIPPLPWPWLPITYAGLLKSAMMAVVTAPLSAAISAAAAGVGAIVANAVVPSAATSVSDAFWEPLKAMPAKFTTATGWIGMLAAAMPLPVANGQTTIASPTVQVDGAPLSLAMPMGGNSCSNIPIAPNASVLGFSNVMTGMSLSQLMSIMIKNAVQKGVEHGLNKAKESVGNATLRAAANSKSPAISNMAGKVGNFLGNNNGIGEGHPIDVASGTLYTEATDFELPGTVPLALRRFYNSRARESLKRDVSALGLGWRHSFDEVLVADETVMNTRSLILRDYEGRLLGFEHPETDGSTSGHPYERLALRRVDGRTMEVHESGRVRVFRFPGGGEGPTPPSYMPSPGVIARLVEVRGDLGEPIRFERDADGRLLKLTDSHRRTVRFDHDRSGRLTDVRLIAVDGRDCDIFLAGYRYDADGRLIEHLDRERQPIRYEYDAASRLTRETDASGYAFHFVHDDQDRCVLTHGAGNEFWRAMAYEPVASATIVTDATGAIRRYLYDDQFRIVSAVDALGHTTKWEYTPEGWPAARETLGIGRTEWTYDDAGRRTSETTGAGVKTEWVYDDLGRLVLTALPGGSKERRTYDPMGRLLNIESPNGQKIEFQRDARGLLVAQRMRDGYVWRRDLRNDGLPEADLAPDGRRRSYTYDLQGHLTEVTEHPAPSIGGNPRQSKLHRDACGRLTGIDRSAGRETRMRRDAMGRVTELRIGQKKATQRWEGYGRLVEHTDPAGATTRVEYDLENQPVGITTGANRRWGFERDANGQTARIFTPDGGQTRFRRDAAGRPVEQVLPNGAVLKRNFDADGRLTKLTWPDGSCSRYTYDAAGRLSQAESEGDLTVRRLYDEAGRLSLEQVGNEWVRTLYDAEDRVIGLKTSWGSETRQRFGSGNELVEIVDPAQGRHGFIADGRKRRSRWERPGGSTRTWLWQDEDRLDRVFVTDPAGVVGLERRLYWAGEDHVEAVEVSSAGRRDRVNFAYDTGGRLTSWRQNDAESSVARYDAADNVLATTGLGPFEVDAADRLISGPEGRIRHDAVGQRVAEARRQGPRRYWYDPRNRLVMVHTEDDRLVRYEYDAFGRRVRTIAEHADRVTEERLLWDGDQLLRRTVGPLGAEKPTRDETYVWDPEEGGPLLRIVRTEAGVSRQLYEVDQRGAAVALLDERGRILWQGAYDPYGQCVESGDEAGQQPLRLAGQVECAATGLRHHRYRVYDPATCRFLTADPVGLTGGTNAYAYPADPVLWADPLGLTGGCAPQARGAADQQKFADTLTGTGWKNVQQNVTFDTASGRTRVNVVGESPMGHTVAWDVQGSGGPPSSSRQSRLDALATTGGVPRGQNASNAGLTTGEPTGPMHVAIQKY